jgi:ribonuclease D
VPAWITDPAALTARLAAARPARVGLDTEFIRERTYWPKLALVQLAFRDADGSDAIVLADPLARGMPAALAALLVDESVLKVMHSPSEDLIALGRECGALPAPLFDTQAAAALAGVGAGMGYQRLVEQVTGTVLRKGETRSDWLRRPLSPAQLEYAADDVRHLFALHDALARTRPPRLAGRGQRPHPGGRRRRRRRALAAPVDA